MNDQTNIGMRPNKDGYYRASFVVDSNGGKQRRITVRGKSEKEVAEKLLRKKIEYENGLISINGNTLLKKWAQEWLAVYKSNILDKQIKRYQGVLNNYICPKIGNMRLKDIKPIHLQGILNDCSGMSQSHINVVRNALVNLFDKAEANDIIVKSPARHLEVPAGTKGELRALTNQERQAFLSASMKHPKGLMFCITLACGLRPGEVRALTWNQIDFENNRIKVKDAIESGKKVIKGTKTKSGEREIPMPAWFYKRLKDISKKNGLVFPSTATDGIMTEQNYYRAWKSFLRLMDIEMGATVYRNQIIQSALGDEPITPYYLRHTFCTDLAVNEVDLKTAQYLMGHADISTTANIYTHVTKPMIDKAEQKMLGDSKGTKRKLKVVSS